MSEIEELSTPTLARHRLAAQLSNLFRERNYATSYIARRCRTTEKVVESWLSGEALPQRQEWDFLLYISRDFGSLGELWDDARSELLASPSVTSPPVFAEQPSLEVRAMPGSPPTSISVDERPTTSTQFIEYACKISGGRVVRLWIPVEFSRADASRVNAFLLTQVDDFTEIDKARS